MTDGDVMRTPIVASRGPRRRRGLPATSILSLATLVVVLATWEAAVHVLSVPRIILPAPSAIAVSLGNSLRTPSFYGHIGVTLYEALSGFVLGGGSGFVLGVLIGQSRIVERTLYPYVVAFQTLPKVAVAPIVLIWFGYGLSSKIVITATISFFPLLANTLAGMRATPSDQRELFRAFTASRWQTFLKLQMPHALPFVFVGIDLSILLSVTGALVGEFVGARSGLGFLILQRNLDLNMAGTFAILTVLGVIGLALHLIVQGLRRWLVFWTETGHDDALST